VHEAEPTEAALGSAQAADVREHQLPGVTDDDVVDLARAMDEDADLTARLDAGLDERPRELGRCDVRSGDATPVEALEGLRCGGREPGGVAVELDEPNLQRREALSSAFAPSGGESHWQVDVSAGAAQLQIVEVMRG
jgi:hypothetical protein